MTVEVKICGVRTPDILDAAVSTGVDFIGLVLFDKSPRNLSIADAARLADLARGHAKSVAVVVDPDDALIDRIASEVRPDAMQLHGTETPERVVAVKAKTGLPVFKAVPVAEATDLAAAQPFEGVADRIIYDTKAPAGADLPGGNGLSFDWTILDNAGRPFALSGGLDAANIAAAIACTAPSLVDVSSGVEIAPGEKDAMLIAEFVEAVRAAAPQHKKAS